MSLEPLIEPENKEALKKKKRKKACIDGAMSKGHRNQLEELLMAKVEQSEQ